MKSNISHPTLQYIPERRQREISSIGRRIRRFLDNLSRGGVRAPKSLKTLTLAAFVIFCVFIAGGGIYDLLDDPLSIVPGPGGTWLAIHPYMGEQTLNESVVAMFLNGCTFGGLLIAYKSSQETRDSKKANYMLVIGLILVLIGLAGSHYLLNLKKAAGR